MFVPRVRAGLSFYALLVLAACSNHEPTTPVNTPSAVAKVSGDGQTGLVGQTLSSPLSVKVTSSSGTAVSGVSVAFAVTSGTATVVPASVVTDATGQAQTQVTLGSSPGTVVVTATVSGTQLVATFTLTAGSATVTHACSTSSPQSPAAGAVLPDVGGTGICLSGGTAGAEYALVAFYANPDTNTLSPTFNTTFNVASQGATAVVTANVASLQTTPTVSPFTTSVPAAAINARAAFDATLRETARRELTPRIPAARAWMTAHRSSGGASFDAIPSTVTIGQILRLNANGNDPCTNPIYVGARVVAITNNSVIVADTANPTGGFTDLEYSAFGTTFDTLIYPLDVSNFGQPTDIDHNGRILILFTKEVNKLTPKGSSGVIGGFFFERDLFPIADTQEFGPGCASSNQGEMFYVLVPDPTGVFSDPRSKSGVLTLTTGTLAHEFQHLINAGLRLYVNTTAQDFEEVWLNEGLSHIAEELLYYHVSRNSVRQNIDVSFFKDTASVNAFNNYQADNFGRFQVFLSKPSRTSVYGDNDSLETRGAIWNLLRYFADHRPGTANDADTWKLLVNTPLTGQANLSQVFGTTYLSQIRDWATSVFSDDIPGVSDARFTESSWNMRNIFPQLCANSSCSVRLGRFPLQVVPLGDGSPAGVRLQIGASAYLRFSVPAGTNASIDWTASGLPVSPLVKFTIVRSK